ncbi:hypothetical protein C3747_57g70 [Trypanosoma cruzi]|uniref:Short-chain dehydrogenase n=1 Tax=Trypanosoma cruzi TaxID=5693 RepID=A0A2V2WSX8_TRYCR|nr:putative short-chain dehydrogenase [Trypanosoma cruzi]PWV11716.1 hypothetical protein C3747_57g70 [Trypanosoma cruzi]
MIFLLFVCITGWFFWSIYGCFAYRRRSVAGKTVLIVGGSSLLGGCLVRRFMQLNANVIVWDSQKKKLDQLLREFGCANEKELQAETRECSPSGDTPKKLKGGEMGAGTQLTANLVDLTNRVQLQRAAKLLGPVHVVVIAADACVSRQFFERNDESSERILLGNVLCSIVLARALLPGMLRQKDGHFVTITNAAGVVGVARHPDYAASHWASVGAHESLQMMIREMGGSGKVRTTLFCLCSDLRVAPAASCVSTSDDNKVVDDKMDPKSPTGSLLVVSPFWSRPVTPEDVAERCIWAVRHGVERVYMPRIFVLFPLLRVLPVPWLMSMISPRALWKPSPKC